MTKACRVLRLATVVLCLMLPTAQGFPDPASLAPPLLRGEMGPNNETIILTWQPPPSWDGSQEFRVYEGNALLARTTGTQHVAAVVGTAQVFYVTMTDTTEGPPSNPIARVLDSPCDLLVVSVIPPGYSIDERCLPIDPIPPVGVLGCRLFIYPDFWIDRTCIPEPNGES